MKDDDLTQKIIGCAYTVHNALGPGFLEKVYENALRIELEKLGLEVKQQEPINVTYDGQVVGEYYADLWVDERVVIELKAAQTLVKQHEVQLVNYLAATGIDCGLLLNHLPLRATIFQIPVDQLRLHLRLFCVDRIYAGNLEVKLWHPESTVGLNPSHPGRSSGV